jgi:hypothetical protein
MSYRNTELRNLAIVTFKTLLGPTRIDLYYSEYSNSKHVLVYNWHKQLTNMTNINMHDDVPFNSQTECIEFLLTTLTTPISRRQRNLATGTLLARIHHVSICEHISSSFAKNINWQKCTVNLMQVRRSNTVCIYTNLFYLPGFITEEDI